MNAYSRRASNSTSKLADGKTELRVRHRDLISNYGRQPGVMRRSVSVDNGRSGGKIHPLEVHHDKTSSRATQIPQESERKRAPPLSLFSCSSLDGYPDPPPVDRKLNARMEKLFEEYLRFERSRSTNAVQRRRLGLGEAAAVAVNKHLDLNKPRYSVSASHVKSAVPLNISTENDDDSSKVSLQNRRRSASVSSLRRTSGVMSEVSQTTSENQSNNRRKAVDPKATRAKRTASPALSSVTSLSNRRNDVEYLSYRTQPLLDSTTTTTSYSGRYRPTFGTSFAVAAAVGSGHASDAESYSTRASSTSKSGKRRLTSPQSDVTYSMRKEFSSNPGRPSTANRFVPPKPSPTAVSPRTSRMTETVRVDRQLAATPSLKATASPADRRTIDRESGGYKDRSGSFVERGYRQNLVSDGPRTSRSPNDDRTQLSNSAKLTLTEQRKRQLAIGSDDRKTVSVYRRQPPRSASVDWSPTKSAKGFIDDFGVSTTAAHRTDNKQLTTDSVVNIPVCLSSRSHCRESPSTTNRMSRLESYRNVSGRVDGGDCNAPALHSPTSGSSKTSGYRSMINQADSELSRLRNTVVNRSAADDGIKSEMRSVSLDAGHLPRLTGNEVKSIDVCGKRSSRIPTLSKYTSVFTAAADDSDSISCYSSSSSLFSIYFDQDFEQLQHPVDSHKARLEFRRWPRPSSQIDGRPMPSVSDSDFRRQRFQRHAAVSGKSLSRYGERQAALMSRKQNADYVHEDDKKMTATKSCDIGHF